LTGRWKLVIPLLLVAAFLLPLSVAADRAGKDIVVDIPSPPFKARIVPGAVRYPKLATPAFTEPGASFSMVLSPTVEPSKVIIDDGYGHRYVLKTAASGGRLEATVPAGAVPGVYDLIIVEKNGEAIGEPHAVIVARPDTYRNMTIVHVTDRHFGVINANGRPAANYDLAADIVALGLPNNTVVIDTGDDADTARDVEYMESLMTDYVLDKPLIGIPGNHDHVGNSPNYAKYRGYWNYTISIYGLYRIVGIDSGGDGYITVAQAEWASRVLDTSKEPVKIVLFHHPHFTHVWGKTPHVFDAKSAEDLYRILTSKKPGTDYMYVYSSWLENRKAFRELVKGMYNAPAKRVLALSGHVHLDSYAEVHRADGSVMNYVVTVATGGSVRPGDYHGFRIIRVSSSGGLSILGDGAYDARHASFNLEGVKAGQIRGPYAVSAYFTISGTKAARYMVKTVVPVEIPSEYLGKKLHLYLQGLDSYRIRCTPLGCVLYAYTNSRPREGAVYRAVLYEKPDAKPPSVRIVRVYPARPVAGRQVVVTLRISDDAWGVEGIEASLLYDGKAMRLIPSIIGDTVRLIIPPLKDLKSGKARLVVRVHDVSGKTVEVTRDIVYAAPQTRTVKQQATTHASTVKATTTTSSTAPSTTTTAATGSPTATTTQKAATSPTAAATHATTSGQATAQGPGATGGATLTVAVIVAAALLAFLFLATRK